MDDKTREQQEFFFNRLEKNYRRLKKWARKKNIGSFRAYDRDIPEIPLALDVYDVQPAGSGNAAETGEGAVLYVMMYLYERPYYKDPGEEEMWLTHMKDAAARALDIPCGRVIVSVRKRQRGSSQYAKSGGGAVTGVVQENGVKFHITLGAYIDTGIFLDHRILRGMVRKAAPHKRVLNLFCYTGAFSAAAALGGASRVDSVDLSNTYLETARRNFSLNGLPSSPAYTFIRSDVAEFLGRAVSQNRVWDIIILDPPTFSNSKKTRETLDINRDWAALVNLCLNALDAGGELYFSTNSGRFRFDGSAVAEKTKHGYTVDFADITARTTSEDFSRRKGRGVWRLAVRACPEITLTAAQRR